jgi:multiple sugar transport system permease protein
VSRTRHRLLDRLRRSRGASNVPAMIFLFVLSFVVIMPFLWMVSLAFTPESEAFGQVSLIPAHPTFENIGTAWVDANLVRAMANSAIVAIGVVLSNTVVSVLAGYAFALLPFRGSLALFIVLISTTAIPVSVTLIPLFLMTRGIPLAGGNDIFGHGGSGLIDTLAGVMLPYLVLPMNIFLARQYFSSASVELAEAARIDGAGEWQIFRRIYLPLARPLVAVVAIFSFVGAWDDFLWPLVVTNSAESQTVQLALARFLASGNVQYGPLMAGAVLATIPVVILFLFNQRAFVAGLADGSVKG